MQYVEFHLNIIQDWRLVIKVYFFMSFFFHENPRISFYRQISNFHQQNNYFQYICVITGYLKKTV